MAPGLARAYRQFKAPRGRRRRKPRSLLPSPHILDSVSEVAGVAPPAVIDWRKKISIRPPGNQGLCYSCTSFALAATIEARRTITIPAQPFEVSAGFIHTCIGHPTDTDPQVICNSGCDMYALLNLLKTKPYALSSPGDYPFTSSACSAAARVGTISGFDEIVDGDTAKRSIADAGPLGADLYIWEDFFSYTTQRSPTYIPDTSTPGPYLHSICVVGFDETGWIIKNSMGPSWGDGSGFATVPYGRCGLIGGQAPPGKSSREAYSITL